MEHSAQQSWLCTRDGMFLCVSQQGMERVCAYTFPDGLQAQGSFIS